LYIILTPISELDSSDNSHFLKTACWEACPRRSRLGERNTPRRRGERFRTRRTAFSASKDTFPPRSTTSPDGGRLLRDYLCGLRRQARAPEHCHGHLVQSAHRFYHAGPRRLGRSCRNPSDGRGYMSQYAGRVRRHYARAARHRAARQACGRVSDRRDREISSGAGGDRPTTGGSAALRDGMDVKQVSSKAVDVLWFYFRLFRPLHFARRVRLKVRTRGTTARRNKRIGLYFEITRFVEGLGKSANARTVFGSLRRHVFAGSPHLRDHDLENSRL
jgi:hypothetical protein